MDECIASHRLASPSICMFDSQRRWQLFTFHLYKGVKGEKKERERAGVGYQFGQGCEWIFFFKRFPFFGAYYGNASASNALSPWRGPPPHTPACFPLFFNDILERGASLWPSDSFEVGPKKGNERKEMRADIFCLWLPLTLYRLW